MGTEPSSNSSPVSRVKCLCFYQVLEIAESDKFQDHFTMPLCSFGGVNDQCSATSWAMHETGMIPLLSCDNDMTAWSKDKYKAVRCVRGERKTW